MYLPNLAFQPYVASVPREPIEDISNLGQTLNKRYDDNLAKQDALDEHIAQLQVRPIDEPVLTSLKNDTRAAIADIAKNGDWENAQVPIRTVARRLLMDPVVTRAQQNLEQEKKLDATKAQMQEQGHHVIQFHDYKNIPTQNADGSFNQMPVAGTFDKKLDYESKMQSIFQGLEANSTAYKNSSPTRDDATGAIYQVGSGASRRYIDTKAIKNVVANNLDNYLNTDEGQQRLRVLTTKNSENGTPLDPLHAREIIKNELTNVGLTKRFNDSSSESSERLAPEGRKSPKDNEDYRLTQDNAYQQNQDLGDLIGSLDKKTATLKDAGSVGGYLVNKGLGALQDAGVLHGKPIDAPQYGKVPDNLKDTYQSLYKVFSSSLNTKDVDKINPKIQEYLKNVQNGKIEPKYYAYGTSKKINEENAYIKNGNLDGRVFLDPDTHKVLTWADITGKNDGTFNKKSISVNGKLPTEDDVKVSGEYSEDNPFVEMTGNAMFASPQKIKIGDKTLIMGSDQQEVHSPTFVAKAMTNGITRATRTGLPVKFNKGLSIIPKGDRYLIQDLHGNLRGMDTKGTPFSLDDVQKLMYTTGNIIPQ